MTSGNPATDDGTVQNNDGAGVSLGSTRSGEAAAEGERERERQQSVSSSSSVQRERERERTQSTSTSAMTALKPVGIVNESNTCFLNSTFQALSATAPLTSLLTSSSSSPLQPLPYSLPPPIKSSTLIPLLQSESFEPPLYDLLPVTRAFSTALHRSWKLKDGGGGTMGSGETSQGRSMSLRSLLREISRKYDQYDDYQQQDAHELLRHLLDSMEMEEKDVIKKLQPTQSKSHDKKRKSKSSDTNTNSHGNNHNIISPLASPLPSPAHSIPSSPIRQSFSIPIPNPNFAPAHSTTQEIMDTLASTEITSNGQSQHSVVPHIPKDQRLIPFVDVLFGGSLASVVVCAKCKSVSHTYEGFLDISLSLKEDDPKPRKRDRLRAMAQRLVPKSSGTSKSSPEISTQTSPMASSISVSDGELSESETPRASDTSTRRKSLDQDDRSSDGGSALSRNNSKSFGGLRNKTSFSFRRKSRASSGNGNGNGNNHAIPPTPPSPDLDRTPAMMPASPKIHGHHSHPQQHHEHIHTAVPTPAQAAYISRILTPPQGMTDPMDPLARLRQAHTGEFVPNATPAEYGLTDSLRAFTSVEVLEGENAFACRKCWKIKHGRYSKHEAPLKEEVEDEDGVDNYADGEGTTSHISSSSFVSDSSSPSILASPRVAAPSISILGSPSSTTDQLPVPMSSSPAPIQPQPQYQQVRDGERLRGGRGSSVSASKRAPSPLRRQLEDESYVEKMAHATLETYPTISTIDTSTTGTGADDEEAEVGESDSSDGLSDSDSSDEESAPTPVPTGVDVNSVPTKSKSKSKSKDNDNDKKRTSHFVMGRAFKRYLIAEAPEIMVFHFKRFKQMYKTSMTFTSFYNLKKIDDFMPFPEVLDLAPYLAPNRKDYKIHSTPNGPHANYMEWKNPDKGPELEPVNYKLYAVVVHLGTMIGGHYIAYCLVDPEKVFGTPNSNKHNSPTIDQGESNVNSGTGGKKKDNRVWCYCSDTSIRLANVSEVLAARAYLCFYEKVHP